VSKIKYIEKKTTLDNLSKMKEIFITSTTKDVANS